MLQIYRNVQERIRIEDTSTGLQHIITLVKVFESCCMIDIDGVAYILLRRGNMHIGACTVHILRIERGVKFGLDASRHIKINRM